MIKYILIVLVLLSCRESWGQRYSKPTDIKIQYSMFRIQNMDSIAAITFHFPDSTIEITGDTTKVLWYMYKCYEDLLNELHECQRQRNNNNVEQMPMFQTWDTATKKSPPKIKHKQP